MQTSTRLNVSTTPFTLANFTQSVQLIITNVNGTSAVPEGARAWRLTRTQACQLHLGHVHLRCLPAGCITWHVASCVVYPRLWHLQIPQP